MKCYFLSSVPCALFLNELYYGVTDSFERFIELSLSDKIYARFCPQGSLALGVFIDETLLDNPPDGVEIYHLKDGVAIYAKTFTPTDFTLRVIEQKQLDATLITVFSQGVLQLSVQSELGYFNAYLPPCFSKCEILFHADLCILKGENTLGVYTKKAETLLLEKIIDFSLNENTLNATLPLSDRLGRRTKCSWRLSSTHIERTEFTIIQSEENSHKEELLAYAFFESMLIGAEYSKFLNNELKEKSSQIKDFIGDFSDVLPTENPFVCGLVKEKKPRVFEVVYYTVEVTEGEISDVFT